MTNAPIFLTLLSACLMISPAFSQGEDDKNVLDRSGSTKLRVASYNVYFGSVFPRDDGRAPLPEGKRSIDDRSEQFLRIHNAVSPDIWALQEVLYSDPQRSTKTQAGIKKYFDKATGENWHTAADKKGRMVFSKYPIRWREEIATRVFGVLIEMPASVSSRNVLLLNLHLSPSSAAEQLKSAKDTVEFLRRVERGEVPNISEQVTILICGDFNSRSAGPPYRVLSAMNPNVPTEGKLNAILKDTHPRQVGSRDDSTFGSVHFEGQECSVHGGRIDFFLYRSKQLLAKNCFILNTLTLDDDTLKHYGLHRNDVAADPNDKLEGKVGFDHLPLVVDFSE